MDTQYSPSFSSSLLDAIYRSIDQGDDKMHVYREAIRKSNSSRAAAGVGVGKSEEEMANFRRACMIEKWMEKKATEKAVVRRKSAADSQTKKPRKSNRPTSCDAVESESFHLPRPVKTGGSGIEKDRRCDSDPKQEGGGLLKTKSRALKIYGELKKAKQPISPGGKLAGFLNSIFTGGGKSKFASGGGGDSPSLKSTSTCSSASSFSRSCLSKTPSSRGKASDGAKRSVRFSQVDEPFLRNKSDGDNRIRNVVNEELMVHMMEKNQAARDLLRTYHMKTAAAGGHGHGRGRAEFGFSSFDDLKKTTAGDEAFGGDSDDDDAASYASSDLFELDNLPAVGNMERYREELPVYETTRLDRANRAGGLVF